MQAGSQAYLINGVEMWLSFIYTFKVHLIINIAKQNKGSLQTL